MLKMKKNNLKVAKSNPRLSQFPAIYPRLSGMISPKVFLSNPWNPDLQEL